LLFRIWFVVFNCVSAVLFGVNKLWNQKSVVVGPLFSRVRPNLFAAVRSRAVELLRHHFDRRIRRFSSFICKLMSVGKSPILPIVLSELRHRRALINFRFPVYSAAVISRSNFYCVIDDYAVYLHVRQLISDAVRRKCSWILAVQLEFCQPVRCESSAIRQCNIYRSGPILLRSCN